MPVISKQSWVVLCFGPGTCAYRHLMGGKAIIFSYFSGNQAEHPKKHEMTFLVLTASSFCILLLMIIIQHRTASMHHHAQWCRSGKYHHDSFMPLNGFLLWKMVHLGFGTCSLPQQFNSRYRIFISETHWQRQRIF